MSRNKRIEINDVKIAEPEELQVERFHIQFPEETLETLLDDPDSVLYNLITQWDQFPVNSVNFVGNVDRVQKDGGVTCYHVVSPERERSNTICL